MARQNAVDNSKFRRTMSADAHARDGALAAADARERLQRVEQLQGAGKLAEAVAELLVVAQSYTSRAAPVKAVAVLRQAVRLQPDNADVRMAYGEVLQQLRMVEDAVREYATACTQLEAAGRYNEWLDVMQRLLAMDTDNLGGRLQLAEALSRAGKTAEAAGAFRSLAEILLQRGEIEDWEKVAERLLFHDTVDTTTAHDLALHYVRSNRHAEALGKLILCYEAVPNDAELLELIITTLDFLGQREKAAVICRELIRTFRRTGLHAEAERALQRLHDLDPDDEEAQERIGVRAASISGGTVIELQAGMVPLRAPVEQNTFGYDADEDDKLADDVAGALPLGDDGFGDQGLGYHEEPPDFPLLDDLDLDSTVPMRVPALVQRHQSQRDLPQQQPALRQQPTQSAAKSPLISVVSGAPLAHGAPSSPAHVQRPMGDAAPRPYEPQVHAQPTQKQYGAAGQPVQQASGHRNSMPIPQMTQQDLANFAAASSPAQAAGAPFAGRSVSDLSPPRLPQVTHIQPRPAVTTGGAYRQSVQIPEVVAQRAQLVPPPQMYVSPHARPPQAIGTPLTDPGLVVLQAPQPAPVAAQIQPAVAPTEAPAWDAPTMRPSAANYQPYRPSHVPALDALASSLDQAQATLAPTTEWDDDEPSFGADDNTVHEDVDHQLLDMLAQHPASTLDADGQPSAMALASTKRRSNALPRPRLARRPGTATDLPSNVRDISKDMSTLDFFIERGFYESAIALFETLQKRHPDSAELFAYRAKIERMHRG